MQKPMLAVIILIVVFCALIGAKVARVATPPPNQSEFEQYPPYVTAYFVQLLQAPLTSGENLIFYVQYDSDAALPRTISVYGDAGNVVLTLRDDGVAPDVIAGDKEYAAYKKEDLSAMVASIRAAEERLRNEKNFLVFTGHLGKVVRYEDVPMFDHVSFQDNKKVEVSKHLRGGGACEADLLKERSLFITDMAVVEDQSRTYNVVSGTGNPTGAWTFGTLMANMENGTHADGVRGFLKDWVRHWTIQQTVNGYTVAPRVDALEHLITPWLVKASQGAIDPFQVDLSTWEALWDATSTEALQTNAPFKLTAIVNRLDLRGNRSYAPSASNSGETRFIFTLINPVTGAIPIHTNQTISLGNNGVGFIDWRGMNVILEYGNLASTCAEQRDLAQAWLNLSNSSYNFGQPGANNAYKDALQAITDLVTMPNAAPQKVNGSAIERVRTNEKLFGSGIVPGTAQTGEEVWESADWEFRQFELNSATHSFSMAPLTNNPDHTANHAPNIQEDFYGTSAQVANSDLIDWIFDGHRFQVLHGNFNLPTSLLSGVGRVRREEAQYLDLNPKLTAAAGGYEELVESAQAKSIRQQLSVNTCAGCHAGETKTVFTHVNALAYGEPARYWLPTLDGAADIPQDPELYPWGDLTVLQHNGKNNGHTFEPLTGNTVPNFTTEGEVKNRVFFQHVSPFLTGRRFVQFAFEPAGNWQDDEGDDDNPAIEFASDLTMEGLFYVNDPSNDVANEFPFVNTTKSGFNDLERRKEALCAIINRPCGSAQQQKSIIHIMGELQHVPLPLGAH